MRINKECMYHYGKYLRVSPFRQPFQLIHANTEKVMKRLISVNQHNYLEKNTSGRSLLRVVVKFADQSIKIGATSKVCGARRERWCLRMYLSENNKCFELAKSEHGERTVSWRQEIQKK